MLTLTLLAGTTLAYGFLPGSSATFDVSVAFDGDLPIFGGRNTQAVVKMGVLVEGQTASEVGQRRIVSDIIAFDAKIGESNLPFTQDNVRAFFPKTTIIADPQGRTIESDAPKTRLPVRLPGLDAQRFPDITYLPLLFPVDGVELGKEFRFRKPFGDSVVEYRVTPTAIDEKLAKFDIALSQTYVSYEDERRNPLDDEAGADYRVETVVTGSGTAEFEPELGRFRKVEVSAVADSKVTALQGRAPESPTRKLKTTLRVTLRE